MRFERQSALVTGATGGIGTAIAERLAQEGANVAVHTHSREQDADELVEELPGDGHHALQADLMDPDGPERLLDATVHAMGHLDLLVNNAGRFVEHDLDEIPYERWKDAWDRTLTLNLEAPAHLSFLAAHVMREQTGGAIINIGSRGAFRGEPNAPAYGASKAGLKQLTQSLAVKLAPHGIQVAAVAPSFVQTPMVQEILESDRGDEIRNQSPLDRVARPDEIAAAVAYLASDEAEFATGAVLDVNGASYLR